MWRVCEDFNGGLQTFSRYRRIGGGNWKEISMSVFGLLGTAFVGLIVGIIAKWLSPGPDPRGFFVTILVGVAGAYLARFLGNALFGWYHDGDMPGWIMSVVGAMLLLWIYRIFQRRAE
jgi:uncharacterized membrane protein YeaQ/YmgE (transglycosylase-associated protein family)